MARVEDVEAAQARKEFPDFGPGDTVRVEVQVIEGEKRRVQAFQGTVIQRRGSGPRETFTVRKVSGGVGVERIFPTYAPGIMDIKVVHRGKVRRAKLNYLRDRKGKAAAVKRSEDTGKAAATRSKVTSPEPEEIAEVEAVAAAEERGGES